MTISVRALAVAAVLAGTLSTPVLAQRSNTAGFNLGVYVSPTAAELEDADEAETGIGLSLHLGYGFGEHFQVFARGAGATIESEGFVNDEFILAHFDLGGRYSFATSASPVRPYLQAAIGGRAASFDLGSEGTLDVRGSGLTAGGGLEYFLSPSLAIEGGLAFTFGEFNEGRLDEGEWQDLDDASFEMNTTRLDLGISWHP